jgi:uncharacterized protein (DUF305 family)
MSGMLTKTEIENLRSSTGAPFDLLFIEGMIAHHKGAISMADLVDGSRNAAVKKLAGNIVKAQTAEIKTMKELLTRLP